MMAFFNKGTAESRIAARASGTLQHFRRYVTLSLVIILAGITLIESVKAWPVNSSIVAARQANASWPRQAEGGMSPKLQPVFLMACFTSRIGSIVCDRVAQWIWDHRDQIQEGICQFLKAFEDNVLNDNVLTPEDREAIIVNLRRVQHDCACSPLPREDAPKPVEVGAKTEASRTSR